MTRPFPARLAPVLALALAVVACGGTSESGAPSASAAPSAPSTAPSPSEAPSVAPSDAPSASPLTDAEIDAIYDAIEDQVDAIRGLEPVDVARQTIDGETLAEMNATNFAEDNPADYVAAYERLLKAFGVIPATMSLQDTYLELIDSQVAGFYRPDDDTLYVVSRSGTINGSDKITFAHEYEHALQDANFPGIFDQDLELREESDEAIARGAVYEGDATILMTEWAIPNLTAEELQDVVAAGSDPEALEVLARTPPFLVDGLLFPYNAGAAFLQPIQMAGGWPAMDEVLRDLPASTEQVLHPEKYEADEAPVDVTLPDDMAAAIGDGWAVDLQDTFGEFQMATWLTSVGLDATTANAAAAGWGGDRLAVFSGPDGAWGLAMRTAWDSPADAQEFDAAATTAAASAGGPAGVFPGAGGSERWFVVGSDDDAVEAIAVGLGLAG